VVVDIEANIEAYLTERRPTDRYASFDYCFNHFQSHREQGRITALAEESAGLRSSRAGSSSWRP
jgi:hypothetical protein